MTTTHLNTLTQTSCISYLPRQVPEIITGEEGISTWPSFYPLSVWGSFFCLIVCVCVWVCGSKVVSWCISWWVWVREAGCIGRTFFCARTNQLVRLRLLGVQSWLLSGVANVVCAPDLKKKNAWMNKITTSSVSCIRFDCTFTLGICWRMLSSLSSLLSFLPSL